MNKIVNISGYLFTTLYDTIVLQQSFKQRCGELALRGSIVFSREGINLMLAGTRESINGFYQYLKQDPRFEAMTFKESLSDTLPFRSLRVKRKSQLVPTDLPNINPAEFTAPRITPAELKRWYDEGKEFTIIDTRNDYEYDYGSFDNAVNPQLSKFREFADTMETVDAQIKEKPVVVFCTGGIRCEKASPIALKTGFKEVYQLEGGIIKYFEEVGGDHYHGDCFVFDQREALTPTLRSIHE